MDGCRCVSLCSFKELSSGSQEAEEGRALSPGRHWNFGEGEVEVEVRQEGHAAHVPS